MAINYIIIERNKELIKISINNFSYLLELVYPSPLSLRANKNFLVLRVCLKISYKRESMTKGKKKIAYGFYI